MQVFFQMIENENCDAPARQVASWPHRTHNLEGMGPHAVATDELQEDSMSEIKPVIEVSGWNAMECVAENYRFMSSVKNSYRDTIDRTRLRSVRAHKVSRKVKSTTAIMQLFLRSGVSSYEREVLEADRTGLENVSLHETAHEIGVIGKAMSYESKHVMLTEEQLRASGNSTCVPGEYRVFRAELIDGPKKGRLLLERCE